MVLGDPTLPAGQPCRDNGRCDFGELHAAHALVAGEPVTAVAQDVARELARRRRAAHEGDVGLGYGEAQLIGRRHDGGLGHRGIDGKVLAAHVARRRRIPYLGLCLGLQCAVIEFAREVLATADANSTEFDMFTEHPVIDFMPDQRDMEDKGGTMRLGLYPARLTPGSHAAAAYGQEVIYERHRHRFEVNNRYRATLEAAGMVLSGQSPDGRLVEIVELRDHPWFVASQFHPEFKSRPERPHPLFDGFVAAAVALRGDRGSAVAAEATGAAEAVGGPGLAAPERPSLRPARGRRPGRGDRPTARRIGGLTSVTGAHP